jgi:surfeit locus 1 family protein
MSDETKKKVFRPRLIPTLVAAVIIAVTCTAGTWQMRRYKEQTAVTLWYHQQHDVLPTVTSLADTAQAKDRLDQLHFRRATLTGHLDMAHAQLLTARVGAGNQLGYDIIVPLQVAGGAHPSLLVNLGWAPPDKLPGLLDKLRADAAPVTLSGRLRISDIPVADAKPVGNFAGLKTWMHPVPRTLAVTTPGLDPELLMEAGEQASGKEIDPNALPRAIYDYPIHPEPSQNFSYSLQWFGMALTAIAVWIALSREEVA